MYKACIKIYHSVTRIFRNKQYGCRDFHVQRLAFHKSNPDQELSPLQWEAPIIPLDHSRIERRFKP